MGGMEPAPGSIAPDEPPGRTHFTLVKPDPLGYFSAVYVQNVGLPARRSCRISLSGVTRLSSRSGGAARPNTTAIAAGTAGPRDARRPGFGPSAGVRGVCVDEQRGGV